MDYIESQNNQKLWNENSKKDLGDIILIMMMNLKNY